MLMLGHNLHLGCWQGLCAHDEVVVDSKLAAGEDAF